MDFLFTNLKAKSLLYFFEKIIRALGRRFHAMWRVSKIS